MSDDDYDDRHFLVLYATETGNAFDLARRLAREGERRSYKPRVTSTDVYPVVSHYE